MRIVLVPLFLAAALSVACEGEKSPTKVVTDAAKDMGNKATETAKDMGSQASEAVKDAVASITDKTGAADWATKAVESAKTQLATLKEKAKNAPAAVKPQVDALLGQIDTQVNALSAKAAEFKNATPETWKKLLDEAKPMVDKIKDLASQVTAKLGG